jgi:hypothetical protein
MRLTPIQRFGLWLNELRPRSSKRRFSVRIRYPICAVVEEVYATDALGALHTVLRRSLRRSGFNSRKSFRTVLGELEADPQLFAVWRYPTKLYD